MFADAGGLFEGIAKLRYAPVIVMAADDLKSNRQAGGREPTGNGHRGISCRGDVIGGLHPGEIVFHLHPGGITFVVPVAAMRFCMIVLLLRWVRERQG
jgi:hypothetical protein